MESCDSKPRRCSFAKLHLLARSTFFFLVDLFFKDTIFYSAIKRDDFQAGYENLEKAAEVEKLDLKVIQDGQEKVDEMTEDFKSDEIPEAKHFDFLVGYRGVLLLLVIIQHARDNMENPGDYVIVDWLAHNISVHSFFVLSAFLLTYRFIKELDARLERHYQTCRSESTSKIDQLRDELKIFGLVTVKYAFRRFFRIYITFLFFAQYIENLYLKELGWSHLWTMGAEIKYYFCIPVISLILVKLKRAGFVLVVLGYMFVFLNEKFDFLPYNLGYDSADGATLTSFFTIFLCGSLIAALYCFYYEKMDPDCVLLSFKKIKSPLGRKLVNLALTVFFLEIFYVCIMHYGDYWNDYAIHTDVLMSLLGLKPERLSNHIHFGVLFSFVLFLMLVVDPIMFTGIFRSSFLQFLGKYSYSTYLVHYSLLNIGAQAFFKTKFEYVVTTIMLSNLCGFLLFYLIENPLTNLAKYLGKRVESSDYFK